ncbi:MAG: hypothetical protein IJ459_02815 [Clostridia bacterium]|nr:hypothetical protein [Clostridia bacterium]
MEQLFEKEQSREAEGATSEEAITTDAYPVSKKAASEEVSHFEGGFNASETSPLMGGSVASETAPFEGSSIASEASPFEGGLNVSEASPFDGGSVASEAAPFEGSSVTSEATPFDGGYVSGDAKDSENSPLSGDGASAEPNSSESIPDTDKIPSNRSERSTAGAQVNNTEDVFKLCLEFPDMRAKDLCRITSDKRYSQLRALGLTPREAYLATSKPKAADNRAHLVTEVPSGARVHSTGMTSWEMSCARALFSDLPESEIKRLYAKVTNQNN